MLIFRRSFDSYNLLSLWPDKKRRLLISSLRISFCWVFTLSNSDDFCQNLRAFNCPLHYFGTDYNENCHSGITNFVLCWYHLLFVDVLLRRFVRYYLSISDSFICKTREGLIFSFCRLLVFNYDDMIFLARGLLVSSSNTQNLRTFYENSLILPIFIINTFKIVYGDLCAFP